MVRTGTPLYTVVINLKEQGRLFVVVKLERWARGWISSHFENGFVPTPA